MCARARGGHAGTSRAAQPPSEARPLARYRHASAQQPCHHTIHCCVHNTFPVVVVVAAAAATAAAAAAATCALPLVLLPDAFAYMPRASYHCLPPPKALPVRGVQLGWPPPLPAPERAHVQDIVRTRARGAAETSGSQHAVLAVMGMSQILQPRPARSRDPALLLCPLHVAATIMMQVGLRERARLRQAWVQMGGWPAGAPRCSPRPTRCSPGSAGRNLRLHRRGGARRAAQQPQHPPQRGGARRGHRPRQGACPLAHWAR